MTEIDVSLTDMDNGTVLLLGVQYPESGSKMWTYAAIKAGSLWYVTGAGRSPQAAGWGAVKRWLAKDGRELKWVYLVTNARQIWPKVPVTEVSAGESTENNCPHHPPYKTFSAVTDLPERGPGSPPRWAGPSPLDTSQSLL